MGHFYDVARQRGAAVARAMLDGGASPEAALTAADRTFADRVKVDAGLRAAFVARGAASETAIRNDPRAARYDWSLYTGKAPDPTMRVRAKAPPPPVDGTPRLQPDALAGMAETARRAACAEVRALVAAYQAKRAVRRDATHEANKITAYVKTGDDEVIKAARAAGWTIKR